MMNIYQMSRDFCGYKLSAVVIADTLEQATNELHWCLDEDTTEINGHAVGVSRDKLPRVLCEESL